MTKTGVLEFFFFWFSGIRLFPMMLVRILVRMLVINLVWMLAKDFGNVMGQNIDQEVGQSCIDRMFDEGASQDIV